MNASVTDIGQYAKIPIRVAHAEVSETAKAVWRELALISRPHNPTVWLRQETLSKTLRLSTRTIRRAITELERNGLVVPDGYYEGRYRQYRLMWQKPAFDVGHACPGSLDTDVLPPGTQMATVDADVLPPRTPMANDPGHPCPPFIIERQIIKPNYFLEEGARENSVSPKEELENLLASYGKTWTQAFRCLDGISGRPSVRECVEQALNHSARHKCLDLKIYVDTWLRNASKSWIQQYHREFTGATYDLSPEAVARKLKEDEERRKRYELQKQEPPRISARVPSPAEEAIQALTEIPETEDERDWIVAKISAMQEQQKRKDAEDAKQKARFGGRGRAAVEKEEVVEDRPICRENNQLMWDFLRIQWADGRRQLAA